jgi:hypothetical protein
LHDSSSLYEGSNLLPSLAVHLQSLNECVVLFSSPPSYSIISHAYQLQGSYRMVEERLLERGTGYDRGVVSGRPCYFSTHM